MRKDFDDALDSSVIFHDKFYRALDESLSKCIATHGPVTVESVKTSYVIEGRLYTVKSRGADGSPLVEVKFWTGVNDKRLFFITYIGEKPDYCKDLFQFTFGGAEKICWEFNYEAINGEALGTSIWGTCKSDGYLMERPRPNLPEELTRTGRFWATDIAMMVQSQIRTMERNDIKCLARNPEPL